MAGEICMKRTYEKPSLKKAAVRLQTIAARTVATGPNMINS
jgi:hypothetical protein